MTLGGRRDDEHGHRCQRERRSLARSAGGNWVTRIPRVAPSSRRSVASPSAEFIADITHMEAVERRLRIMDLTALTLCMENGLPIHVFNMDDERNIDRIVSGERVGTLVAT